MTAQDQHDESLETKGHQSTAALICEYVKLFVATCVVVLLVAVAFTGISNNWCVLKLHPAILFLILAFCITLLAYVEALHYACVSVEKWDMNQYIDIYPRAYKCYKLVDTPAKVKKFLVGRQFFVIFVVFLMAQVTSFPDIPQNFLGMPEILVILLVQTGLPGVAITLTFGQLISQIYVEEYTLEFLNLYGCEFVIRLSLATEWCGVCNFSWLLYHTSSMLCCTGMCSGLVHKLDEITGQVRVRNPGQGTSNTADGLVDIDIEGARRSDSNSAMSPTEQLRGSDHVPLSDLSDNEQRTWFDLFKYCWSSCATLGAVVVVLYGISIQSYVLPTPVGATYIIFFSVLILLFYLEGLMIAIVATQYWDRNVFKDTYPRAYKLHELLNRPDNVKRFIIGRQFCTVLTGFLLAQITTFAGWSGAGFDPIGFYIIVKSGLVGVLIVLSFGQLMPELLAQEFPLKFMNTYLAYTVGWVSLYADAFGVGHCAWTIYFITRRMCCVVRKGERDGPVVRMNSGDGVTSSDTMPFSRAQDGGGERTVSYQVSDVTGA